MKIGYFGIGTKGCNLGVSQEINKKSELYHVLSWIRSYEKKLIKNPELCSLIIDSHEITTRSVRDVLLVMFNIYSKAVIKYYGYFDEDELAKKSPVANVSDKYYYYHGDVYRVTNYGLMIETDYLLMALRMLRHLTRKHRMKKIEIIIGKKKAIFYNLSILWLIEEFVVGRN